MDRSSIEVIYIAVNGCIMVCQGEVTPSFLIRQGELKTIGPLLSSHIQNTIISFRHVIQTGFVYEGFPASVCSTSTTATR